MAAVSSSSLITIFSSQREPVHIMAQALFKKVV